MIMKALHLRSPSQSPNPACPPQKSCYMTCSLYLNTFSDGELTPSQGNRDLSESRRFADTDLVRSGPRLSS